MSRWSRTIYFDLETSGRKAGFHEVIQFAGIAVDDVTMSPVEELEVKVFFDVRKADQKALEVNSYDEETWQREGVILSTAWLTIKAFLERHRTLELISRKGNPYKVARLAAWNGPGFDKPFLWEMARGEFVPADHRVLDPMQLALWAMPGRKSYKLIDVARDLGVAVEGDAHDALVDVENMINATARIKEGLGL